MKILSRYVFREILASSFLATTLATFVIFLQQGIAPLVELLVRSGNLPMFLERSPCAFIMTGFHARAPRQAFRPAIRTFLYADVDRAQL